MLHYTNYIDPELEQTPYSCGLEETAGYLSWLDLFLEGYRMFRESEEDILPEIRRQLHAGAQSLHRRRLASGEQDISRGLSICSAAAAFGLTGFGFFCLLLAVAPELDEKYSALYRELRRDGESHCAPTFAFAQSLYALYAQGEGLSETIAGLNALRVCPLFVVKVGGERASLLRDSFTASPQLASLLKGDFALEGALLGVCTEYHGEEQNPVLCGDEAYHKLAQLLNRGTGGAGELIHLTGERGSGRKFLTAHAAGGRSILYVDVPALFALGSERGACMGEIMVRSGCLDSLVVLSDAGTGKEELPRLFEVLNFAFRHTDRVLLTTRNQENMYELAIRYRYSHIPIPPCKAAERKVLWEYYARDLAFEGDVDFNKLAYTYRFTPGTICKCIRQARQVAVSNGRWEISAEDLREAIRHFNSSKLAELAVYIPQKFGWDDIEIDPGQKQIMRLAAARAALGGKVNEEWGFERKLSYGKGISVLMYGPPGTGKTMAAQVMAREIGMDLYRVDLSQLVDKYIGETEKNIGKIFDCAKEGNFILFFDEADAMFSKRTDIESSNDKHANTETAYLLQKMEEYDGITFLATNRFGNFDDAFLRRLTYTVRLEMPDAQTRLRLFEGILPKDAPRSPNLDLKFFADTFELTGSNIKNILYDAAFMAAMEDAPISNSHIVWALKHEYVKQRKMLNSVDLGIYAIYLS